MARHREAASRATLHLHYLPTYLPRVAMMFPQSSRPTAYRAIAIPTQQDATAARSEKLAGLLAEEPLENAANSRGKDGRADARASELLVELGKKPWVAAVGSCKLVLSSDARLSGAHRARTVDSASEADGMLMLPVAAGLRVPTGTGT